MSSRSSLRVWKISTLVLSALAFVLAVGRYAGGEAAPRAAGARAIAPAAAAPPEPAAQEPARAGMESVRPVDSLVAALRLSQDPEGQQQLLNALAALGDESAVQAIAQLALRDERIAERAYAAIGRIGGERARVWLSVRLSEAPESELPALAAGLAELADAGAVQALIDASRSSKPALALAALRALATLDAPEVRTLMLERLGNPIGGDIAEEYFTDALEPRAVPALERLAGEIVCSEHANVFSALLNQGAPGRAALARLLRGDLALSDAVFLAGRSDSAFRPTLRAAALARLRAGANAGDIPFDYLASDLSAEARNALASAAHERSDAYMATHALASRGDPASRRALASLGRDPDPVVAATARCALLENPDSRSLTTFPSSDSPDLRAARVAALLAINSPQGPAALRALETSGDPELVSAAARITEHLGAVKHRPVLREMALKL